MTFSLARLPLAAAYLLLLAGGLSLTSCALGRRVVHAVRTGTPIFPGPGAGSVAPATAASPTGVAGPVTPSQQTSLYAWDDPDPAGPLSMVIDLSEQKARVRRGDRECGWTYVATGKPGFGTPTGNFRILEKSRYKTSNTWGKIVGGNGRTVDGDARRGREGVPAGGRFVGASMPYWMRIHGGIGMHAGPIPNPGSPASHGCIRLPRGMAEILFANAPVGTPVSVVP